MTRIIKGVLNFQKYVFGENKTLFKELGKGQKPLALFITCSDSRIDPTLLAHAEPGELFVLRNAGNLVPSFGTGPTGEAATIEYALVQLRIREIILCGHSKCGAMHGLLEPPPEGKLPTVVGWLNHAKEVGERVRALAGTMPPDKALQFAIEQNVLVQLEHLRGHPAVQAGLEARALRLHGWVYHFEEGRVDAYDALSGKFVPLAEQFRQRMLENADKTPNEQRSEWDTHI